MWNNEKIHKMYCQATNVEWEIMKKYTKCTVKLQMLNRNNEKNTQNVPSSYKCWIENNEKITQNVQSSYKCWIVNNEKNTQNLVKVLVSMLNVK